MMKLSTILVVGVLGLASQAARADDSAEIKALYAKLTAAMTMKNVNAVMALAAPGFTMVEPDGKVLNAQQARALMNQEFKSMGAVKSLSISPTAIKVSGRTAKVKTKFSGAMSMVDAKGEMGPIGKSHTLSMSGIGTNTLVKTSKGWLFKSTSSKTEKMMLDGKPFNPQAAAPKR